MGIEIGFIGTVVLGDNIFLIEMNDI
jgi:hypothetical protein